MDQRLIEILVCPICKGKLVFNQKEQEIICKFDKLGFPIRDDIPVMLETEARTLNIDEIKALP